MVLKKGILFLQVEVLDLRVRFGADSTRSILRLAETDQPETRLSESIAKTAIGSQEVSIETTFRRDVGLGRFISEARKAAERVWKAGVIDREDYRRVHRALPFWYRALNGRGVRSGDRMSYRIEGDRLHTRYVTPEGTVLVDQVNEDESARRTVLGTYFVEGSDFREELIESLLENAERLRLEPDYR